MRKKLVYFLAFYLMSIMALSFNKYISLDRGLYDLYEYTRIIQQTIQGNFFYWDFLSDLTHRFFHFQIHSNFLLILLLPFYYLYSNPFSLIIVQNISILAASVVLYMLGKASGFKENYITIFTFSFLLSAPIIFVQLEEFHPMSFFPLIAYLLYYNYIKNNKISFFLCLLLLLFLKENMLAIGFIVLALLFKYRREWFKTAFYIWIFSLMLILFISGPDMFLLWLSDRYDVESFSFSNYNLGYFLFMIINYLFALHPISYLGFPILLQNGLSSDPFMNCFLGHHSTSIYSILYLSAYLKLSKTKVAKWFILLTLLFSLAIIITNGTILPQCHAIGSGTFGFNMDNNLNNFKNIKEFDAIPTNSSVYVAPIYLVYFVNHDKVSDIRSFCNEQAYDFIIATELKNTFISNCSFLTNYELVLNKADLWVYQYEK